MASSLTNTFNITDSGTLELDGASYVTTAVVGGITYVLVAGRDDAGVSVFSLAADGGLTPVFDFADNGLTNLSGAFALTSVVVGGTTYLYTAAIFDYGVSGFSVAANGALTNVANVADDATLQLALTTDVETAVVGGTTYLFSGGANDGGVSVFSVAANGALTNVDNVIDDATSRIAGPQGMTTAVVGGTTYLFVTGYHDDGVGVFSVAANGDLTNVFNVQDTGLMELDGPVDVITAVVGGTTYLFVTGFDDDGVSVFSVAANGALTNVFNLPDDGLLELDNPVGMSIAVLGGTTYLFVVGADDDGLSVFSVAANGALTNVANVTDAGDFELDRPIGVTTVAMNGQIHVIVASNFDDGVSTFVFDDGINEQPTLTATGHNPTFTEGGAAADLFGAPAASTVEPGQTFTSLTLTVTNVTDGANEFLSFLGTDLALTDGNSVAGVTVSLAGTTATVTFPGAADAAALQALIDSLAYRNASQNPTGADRVITITSLSDSGGTAGGGDDTAALSIVATVNVDPANDAAIITGDTAGDVTEAGAVDNGAPTASGNLDATDADNTNDAWQATAAGSASANGFGTYVLNADGTWTYTLDNDNPAVQALNGADTLTDSFVALTEDGTSQTVTITILAQNDAAAITGDATGAVTESGLAGAGIATDSGDLASTDADNANDAWQTVAAGSASANGYGTYEMTAAGVWTYTLDNANAAVQALNGTDTLTDTFTALTADGTARVVTIAITGANDAAIITGTITGDVTEAGGFSSPGTPTATGNLDSADVDNPDDAWTVVAAGTATLAGFGTYQVTADGQWTYTLDNANAAVQALNGAATLTDTFSVATADGTTQLVSITIHAQNDAATITGDAAGSVTESGVGDSGDLDATDPDNAVDTWQAVAAGAATANGFGSYAISASGVWTYTLDNDNAVVQALNGADTLTDSFTALTADGTAQLVTVTIHAQNDAAIITGTAAGDVTEAGGFNNSSPGTPAATGNLDSTDVDDPDDAWTVVAAGTATLGGFGTYQVTADGQWTYTLDNANAAVQALNGAATLTDTFSVVTADGTTQLVSITIHAQNDAATITGDASGAVTESGVGDSGDLNATDPDNAVDTWQAVAAGAATANGFGSYAISASGVWSYTLDNDNAAVQALNGADTLTDSFTALTADGTAQLVTVTIHAQNDAAIITGTAAGDVTEAGGFNNSSPGTPTATGNLDSDDVDNPDDAWTVVAAGTATLAGFGTYQVAADGQWTYTLDNNNAAVQALNGVATDTFNVVTVDGTARLVTITIHPQNDAAIIGGVAAGAVTEAGGIANGAPGTPAATGNLAATDPDNPNDSWQAAAAGAASALGYGTYQLSADGVWTYTLDDSNAAVQALNAGATLFDAFTALTADGTGREVAITIHGRNDAAIITGDAIGAVAEAGNGPGTPADHGDLDATDVDNGADAWQAVAAGATANGHGTYALTAAGVWTYTLDNDNAAVQALKGGEKLTDSFTALTADGTARVVTVTIDGQDDPQSDPGPAVITGSPGPDSFTVPSGDALINALTGVDTVTFGFRLVDASVTYQGNRVVIDGPGSHTVVTGAERFVFTDGTVDNNDGNPLVDDLFYYSKYHDVWNAHADADAHYDTFGRHEHRDPNAFFSTDIYLSVSPEARAAGGNPLSYFDAIGWQAGRIPSLAFDPAAYLAANPDVAAAHVDPLRHYLQFGYQEGRQPVAPTESLTADGFDVVYYLTHNPDVAGAHVDPLQHFRTFGWKEGRDPNALFDTSGYLAAYADVKAAGINPLDHYNQFGWQEGRDPSADFDTSDYLAAYPDVAAAHVNPLLHYLHNGVHEGRSAFADGVLG